MARRRKKIGITRTLFRAWEARASAQKRARETARRVASKKAAAAQKQIARDSRTTAGELRASGRYEWNAQGMPDSTVMEPKRTDRGVEWVPAKVQPKKKAPAGAGRPPAVPGMRAVRQGSGWAYVPILASQPVVHDGIGDPERFGQIPANRSQAQIQAERNAARGACGAPTKTRNKAPCEHVGDCPIPAHKRWRQQHGR